jgi:hypothetical protein
MVSHLDPTTAGLVGLFVIPALGCLFTNPINMPPTVSIIEQSPHIWHHQDAQFTAEASDPDGDPVRVAWAHTPGDCASSSAPGPNGRGAPVDPATAYTVPASDTVGPFCVWVFATDRYGATTPNHTSVVPEDRLPTADLQIVRPVSTGAFPLYTEMKFSAAGSMDPDGDALSFGWNVFPTDPVLPTVTASVATALTPCREDPPDSTQTICFVPPTPGQYTIRVEVFSGAGIAPVLLDKTFVVAPDQLPCIADTTPPLTDPLTVSVDSSPLVFKVNRVTDDGDPYPVVVGGGTPTFSWFVGPAADSSSDAAPAPLVYQEKATLAFLTVYPFMYQLGDQIRVRVEIHDRNPAPIDALLAGCNDGDALCPPASTCYQRKTWTVVFQ